MNRVSLLYRSGLICAASASMWLAGCANNMGTTVTAPVTAAGTALQGSVHGGQQPVSGAALQLYAASAAGYGAASYTLLAAGNVTNSTGGFSITGDYTCPTSASQVYLVATGGNSGGGINPNLAMMAALGACGNLSPSTFINMNEVTTVAGVWALAPFMSSYTAMGSSPTNTLGLTNAFAVVNKLVNTTVGSAPGPALPASATAPVTAMYTLADILASCINSTGGTAGGNNACGMLFTAATPAGGIAPSDTLTAALNIAKNPGRNVSTLLALVTPSAPFQPTMTSATDFTLSIKYKGGSLSTPSASAIDAGGNVWITNSGNNTVSELSTTGAPVAGSPYSGAGLSGPSGVAIDALGDAWVSDKTSSKISVFTPAGVGSQPTVSGLNLPTAVSIDGQGIVWVANSGSSSVTAIVTSGTSVTSATSYTGAGISAPVALAINPH